MKCVLCGKESEQMKPFQMTTEARKLHDEHYQGMSPDKVLAENGVCDDCMALPPSERKKLADKAIKREMDEYRSDLMKEALKKRGN